MATRLYGVATTAAPITPGFAGWVSTTGAVQRSLATTKAAATETRSAVAVTSGAGNNTLAFQLISDPLSGAQTITGTATFVTRGRELAGTDNVDNRVATIRVVQSDGVTYRGTLLSIGNFDGSPIELGTTLAGVQHVNAQPLTSLACQSSDRIVIEVGYGLSGTGTTPQYDMVIGGNGTDHANTEGDTTGTVPWFEFSQNLTFGAAPTAASPIVVMRPPRSLSG